MDRDKLDPRLLIPSSGHGVKGHKNISGRIEVLVCSRHALPDRFNATPQRPRKLTIYAGWRAYAQDLSAMSGCICSLRNVRRLKKGHKDEPGHQNKQTRRQ
jgi:hypothetical protein